MVDEPRISVTYGVMPPPLQVIPRFLAVIATAQVAAPIAAAGPAHAASVHVLPLVRQSETGQYCTHEGRYCVRLIDGEKGPRPSVTAGRTVGPAPPAAAAGDEFTVWPLLFALEKGGFLAGVQHRQTTAYSGGGGSVTTLQLYEIFGGGKTGILPVLDRQIEGSLMIRACFSQQDMQKRQGACHDEYRFSARIGLAPGYSGGRPILTYTSQAWSFPRGVSRSADSSQRRALQRADLVRQRDPRCSFTRTLRFDQEWGFYRPERPMPDCSDYTSP